MARKLFGKYGDVNLLRVIINNLGNFDGYVIVDNNIKIYIKDSAYKCYLNNKPIKLREVFKMLNDKNFYIEVYENSNDNNLTLNSYTSLVNLPDGVYKIIPKRFKKEFGYIKIFNKKIVYSAYITKNKVLTKNMALAKIKTLFAVSNILVEKVDEEILKKYDGYLFKVYSLNELISKIKSKGYKKAYGSLKDVLTEEPSLIEVGEGYIVSKAKKPIYAFYKDFDGNKAFRYLKSLCIVEDIEFKIYPLDEEEYKAFSLFSKNRVIQ